MRPYRTLAAFVFLASMLLGGWPAQAEGQWSVSYLHPFGASGSTAVSVRGNQQVGLAHIGGVTRAGMWGGTAGSWTALHPVGATTSVGTCASLDRQGGWVVWSDGISRAAIWSGAADSLIDLHPAGATLSAVYGMDELHQVGRADVVGVPRPSLWEATSDSWVDLSPPGSSGGEAFAARGGQQVGWVRVGLVPRACLWTGTTASWTDLHPATASSSVAYATDGISQVGAAEFDTVQQASLWFGTPASRVSLHPNGASESYAVDVHSGKQVGYVGVRGRFRASLWCGTAATWEDLSAALAGSWGDVRAESIWEDGSATYVAGYGFNLTTQRFEALLWMRPSSNPCQPSMLCPTDWNDDGMVNSSDISAFLSSWLRSIQDGTLEGDFTGNGVVNSADISAFVSAWLDDVASGC